MQEKCHESTSGYDLGNGAGTVGKRRPQEAKPDQAASRTAAEKQQAANTEPAPGTVKLTPDVVRSAQQRLNEEGYHAGTTDGRMGPTTRAAIHKYQEDKGLKVNSTLDESTLSHLNVGGGQVMATAPGDIGRGARAAGHDIKEGHPIEAGKDFGKGVGHAGKAVGEGTKSGVVGTEHKMVGGKSEETPKSKESTPPPQ
ncbi:MAG TPA: peptidoglycan-binding domain-containing protein [Candidatus Binatia bacterium]|nr:peptidoglycan-binding domain-containing protein [Candidatus Binatia bacterium]